MSTDEPGDRRTGGADGHARASRWAERYRAARQNVLRMLPKRGKGAEIGVWRGDFSAQILAEAQPATLHLIDPWRPAEDPGHQNALYSAARGADMEAIFQSVCERFAQPIASGQVVVHRSGAADAMASLPDGGLDFVYVDGDHAYKAVRADLDLAHAKCRTGGMIVVDDYMAGKWWGDDVIRATNDFIGARGAGVAVVYAMMSQVVMVKR